MKKLFVFAVVLCLLWACDPPTIPDPPAPVVKAANIVLDSDLTMSMTTYGRPQFTGFVKNVGNGTGYNCMIEITCYSDAAMTTIIDVADGFPANLGDIPVGVRAAFEAVAFELNSLAQIVATTAKITWLNR